ncbi:MAG: ABC transporter ATP-binding protein [Bdellovibrionota bacterium]
MKNNADYNNLSEAYHSKSLLYSQIRAHWHLVVAAFFFTFALAVVAAVIGTATGPSFKLLSGSYEVTSVLIADLVGPKLAFIVSKFCNVTRVATDELIKVLPLILIVVASLKAIFFLLQWYLWEVVGEKIARSLRSKIISGYLYLSPDIKDVKEKERFEEDIASNVSIDIKMLKDYFVRYYGGMPRELLQAIFLGITLYLLSAKLFFIFFLGLLPIGVAIKRLGKAIYSRSEKALENFSDLTEWLQQRLSGIETIKHYHTEKEESQKFKKLTDLLFNRFYKSVKAKAKSSPLIETAGVAAFAYVIYISLSDVNNENITGSVVLSFLATLGLMSQSITRFGKYYNSNREAAAAVKRIVECLNFTNCHQQPVIQLVSKSDNVAQDLVLSAENVTVTYGKEKDYALNRFSYHFYSNKMYCICGHSGAGKSTLMKVLLGLVQPESGNTILYKQHKLDLTEEMGNYKDVPLYVPQEISLFSGSIRENVAYPEQINIDDDKVRKSLERVQLLDFLLKKTNDLSAILGTGALELSGGQKQRIILARLWYHQNKVMIIDEGTSALDPKNEAFINQSLRQLADSGCCIIIVAHRLSTLSYCDQIVLLDKGKITIAGESSDVQSSQEFRRYLGKSQLPT